MRDAVLSRAPALWSRYAVACRFDIETVRVCIVCSAIARPFVSSRYRASQSIRVQLSVILQFFALVSRILLALTGVFIGLFSMVPAAAVIPIPIAARFSKFQLKKFLHLQEHVSQIFNFKNIAMSSAHFSNFQL